MCVQRVIKYQKWKIKWDRYFVNEVETQLKEKPLWGSQTQEIHYSEDKASTKTVTLTYPYAVIVSCTLIHNPTEHLPTKSPTWRGLSMDSFTLGLLPKIDFNTSTTTTHRQQLES
jgi:hypothetical protein